MKVDLDKILFFDIETVQQTAHLSQMNDTMQALWSEKFESLRRRMPDRYDEDATAESAFENGGGIYSEFAKVVCISVGFMYQENGSWHLRTKSFSGDDERVILQGFADLLNKKQYHLCGHNIKEFDVPFICRRMLINGIPLPRVLDVAGARPWETSFIDTLELWKFGDYKNYTSLKLLCAVFGIPTPKDDIDGSEMAGVYYNEHNVARIAVYCEKDVVATTQVYLRLNGEPLIDQQNIESVTSK